MWLFNKGIAIVDPQSVIVQQTEEQDDRNFACHLVSTRYTKVHIAFPLLVEGIEQTCGLRSHRSESWQKSVLCVMRAHNNYVTICMFSSCLCEFGFILYARAHVHIKITFTNTVKSASNIHARRLCLCSDKQQQQPFPMWWCNRMHRWGWYPLILPRIWYWVCQRKQILY